jgi:uncharacterized protein
MRGSCTQYGAMPSGYCTLRDLSAGRVTGPRVHDARIAALCKQHGVAQLWSADGDFRRYAGIRVSNPLVA